MYPVCIKKSKGTFTRHFSRAPEQSERSKREVLELLSSAEGAREKILDVARVLSSAYGASRAQH